MKIKLINYPYGGYKVGEICDFGEEKNKSLVSLQRAVFVEEDNKPKKTVKKVVRETPKTPENKKFLQNKLQQEVQKRKLVLSTSTGSTSLTTSPLSVNEPEGEELEKEPEESVPDQKPKPEKQFLQNELKDQVKQRKETTPKKSFWDKLK